MIENLKLHAPAIHCGGCGNSIERSLSKLTGVTSVGVDVEDKTIAVTFDPAQVTVSDILLRLDLAGYAAQQLAE